MRDSTLVEKYKHRGCTIRVERDEDAESPRQWENLGKMVCWHGRYNLGDEQPKIEATEYLRELARELVKADDAEKISEEHIGRILKKHTVQLPLYLYDHSGITISTGLFSCSWDSGQVGFIYLTMEQARKEWKNITDEKELRAKVEKMLETEVEVYDQYLTGEVYGYATEDWEGNDIASCWGFFGYEETKLDSYMVGEAKGAIDYYIEHTYPKKCAQPGEVDQLKLELQMA
jgi:hypothetical protein